MLLLSYWKLIHAIHPCVAKKAKSRCSASGSEATKAIWRCSEHLWRCNSREESWKNGKVWQRTSTESAWWWTGSKLFRTNI